jgi:hypothetical protein
MYLIDEDTMVVIEAHDHLKLTVKDGGLGALLYHFELVTCVYIKRAHPTSDSRQQRWPLQNMTGASCFNR